MTPPNKIYALESLRGIAAICVALFHFRVNSFIVDNDFIRSSWLMVDFFFVLSGFVIALNYQNNLSRFVDIVSFQLKRFFRLYPLHIVTLLIYLGLECIQYYFIQQRGLGATAFAENNGVSFVHNLFLTQTFLSLFGGYTVTWNTVSWSISAEFYTYIIFALSVFMLRNKKIPLTVLSVAFVLISYALLIQKQSIAPSETGFIRCLYSFFLGVICFNYQIHFTKLGKSRTIVIIGCLSVIAIIFAARLPIFVLYFIPMLFCSLVLASTHLSPDMTAFKVLNNRRLVYLGTISYGLYMLHPIVAWGLKGLGIYVFGFTFHPAGRYVMEMPNQFIATMLTLIFIAISIIAAHFSFLLIEKPFNKMRRKISKP